MEDSFPVSLGSCVPHQLLVFDVMLVSYSSTTIKTVCKAAPQAETFALQNVQDAGEKIRIVSAQTYGHLMPGLEWYDSARDHVPHVMLSDCRSLVDHPNVEVPAEHPASGDCPR